MKDLPCRLKQSVILAACSQLIYTSTSFKDFTINPQKVLINFRAQKKKDSGIKY